MAKNSFALCAGIGVVLAVLAYVMLYEYSKLLPDEPQIIDNTPKPAIDSAIDRIKYDLFNVSNGLHEQIPPKNNNLLIEIRKVNGKDLEKTIHDVVSDRLPYVITDSIATKWNALKWDLWDLASLNKWPILKNVLSLPPTTELNDVFVVESERDVGGMINTLSTISSRRSPEVVPESYFADFLFDVRNSTIKQFYSANYRVIESIAKLEEDTDWKSHRIVEYLIAVNNISIDQIAPLLNILYPGAVLQARYSEYHTIKTQIKGSSRFTLFAPENLRDLYLFPSIHLSYQQSQVDLYDQELQNIYFPRYKSAMKYDITLQPGESLYIPAYWAVHEEAEKLSVTLDVLSASHEQLMLTQAYQMPLPFGKLQTKEERVISSQVYLVHVLSRIAEVTTIKKYSSMLYKSRYSILYPESGIYLQKNTFHCYAEDQTKYTSIVNKLDKYQVMDRADVIAEIINDESISKAIRWVWIGNYVEQIARWAMGDPNQAVLFIRECLDMDSKLEVVKEVEGPKTLKMNPE